MTRIAINGLGRIGRAALKTLLDDPQLQVVAVNDIAPAQQLAYLLNFDSVYGKAEKKADNDENNIYIDGKAIRVLNIPNPQNLPWRELGIDLVLECTGRFTEKQDLEKHLEAGAKTVILSAPSKNEDITTIVHGVNFPQDENETRIVSTASCTTNCIAPVIEVLNRRIGVRKAVMTTMHSYTSSQSLVDEPSKDLRKGRSAPNNFIPSSTGAAKATGRVLPEFKNRFDGIAVRGPVPVGSLADITVVTARPTSVEEINNIFREEAGTDRYRGIVGINVEPIVSSDIIKDPRASVIDLCLTQVIDGDLVKVMSWYDNEWGYANQMVKEARRLAQLLQQRSNHQEFQMA